MSSLGFESAKIQGNIGEIYFQAYIGFGVSLAHIYHAMKGKLLDHFLLYPIPYIVLAICTSAIIIYRENIRKFIEKRALKSITKFIQNNSPRRKLLKTILLSGFFTLTLIFTQPLILILAFILISTIFLYLYIPLQAGEISAKDILQNTSCKTPEFIATEKHPKNHAISCSSIITKDKNYIFGKFIYSDDLNYYFIVNNEIIGTPSAKIIPIDTVKEFSSNIYINKNVPKSPTP